MLSSCRSLYHRHNYAPVSSRSLVGLSCGGVDRDIRAKAGIEQLRHVTVDGQGLELLLARAKKVSFPCKRASSLLQQHWITHRQGVRDGMSLIA